jgi:Enoyl-CoA hydratase/isomerase
MSNQVLVERRGAVQVIVINRPEARNALNGAVAAGIRDAADELDARDDLRAGVLTGAGGTFSSGMDLKAFLSGELPSFPGRGLCGITQTPPRKPLVGAAEGWALAGGFELLLACDLVVAGASARFGVPEVTRSLVAGAGGALLLARRVPWPWSSCSPATRSTRPGPPRSGWSTGSYRRAGRWRRRSSWPSGSRPTGRWPSWPPSRSRITAATGPPSSAGIRPPR